MVNNGRVVAIHPSRRRVRRSRSLQFDHVVSCAVSSRRTVAGRKREVYRHNYVGSFGPLLFPGKAQVIQQKNDPLTEIKQIRDVPTMSSISFSPGCIDRTLEVGDVIMSIR